MIIELPETLGPALRAHANARGVSVAGYVREIIERDLSPSPQENSTVIPFKTGSGIFSKYGPAPSAEEIDANRADMFRNFGEHF